MVCTARRAQCGEPNRKWIAGDSLTNWRLTAYDALGAEMMYPWSYAGHNVGCRLGCFLTGAVGAVARADGMLVSEWTTHGVVKIEPSWNLFGYGEALSASVLPNGTTALAYAFLDQRGRGHTGGGTVNKSNSAFTAIFSAI